jgi:hypothetical protein
MFTNRFSMQTIALIVTATALLILLAVNASLGQRRGEAMTLDQPQNAQAMGQAADPDPYYPVPPGKQTALVNVARQTCLHKVHEAQTMSRVTKPARYYPPPHGKQTVLVNAAIQACIDKQLAGAGLEKLSN